VVEGIPDPAEPAADVTVTSSTSMGDSGSGRRELNVGEGSGGKRKGKRSMKKPIDLSA